VFLSVQSFGIIDSMDCARIEAMSCDMQKKLISYGLKPLKTRAKCIDALMDHLLKHIPEDVRGHCSSEAQR